MTNTGDTDAVPSYRDEMGRYRTQSLFFEFYIKGEVGEKYPPVFTLKENEHEGLPSIRQLFLSYNDPTGYLFAKAELGSYEHWKKLCSLKWFQDHLDSWLEELEIKLRAEGIKNVIKVAEGSSGNSYNASKWLADRGWSPKRGRPSKAEKQAELKRQTKMEEVLSEDAARVNNVIDISKHS